MSLAQWQHRGVEITHARPGYVAGHWGRLRWSMTLYDGRWEATGAIAGVGNEVYSASTQAAALHGLVRLLSGRLALTMHALREQADLLVDVLPAPSPAHLRVLRAVTQDPDLSNRAIAHAAGYSHTYVAQLARELETMELITSARHVTETGRAILDMMESDQ